MGSTRCDQAAVSSATPHLRPQRRGCVDGGGGAIRHLPPTTAVVHHTASVSERGFVPTAAVAPISVGARDVPPGYSRSEQSPHMLAGLIRVPQLTALTLSVPPSYSRRDLFDAATLSWLHRNCRSMLSGLRVLRLGGSHSPGSRGEIGAVSLPR